MTNAQTTTNAAQVAVTDLPAMTAAEFKASREYLGLSTKWIADHLVVGERRLLRMEAGQESIPQVIIELMDEIHAETKQLFEQLSATYRRQVKAASGAPVLLPTYLNDKASKAAGQKFPSRWHRHVAARVADSCPGAILTFFDEPEDV